MATIRIDLPRKYYAEPPPITYGMRMMAQAIDWPDAVLHDCPHCGRVHLVALTCPPADAETEAYLHDGRTYARVLESVT